MPSDQLQQSFADEMMCKAFSTTPLKSEGSNMEDVWRRRCARVVHFKSQQYNLPGGDVGREFVSQLTDEISRLATGEEKSERFIAFMAVMLQRGAMVKRGADVRRLVKRRMAAWRESRIDELIQDAERCAQQWPRPQQGKQDDEHMIRVFTRLMLRGQVRSAVHWMTNRASSGSTLDPSELVHPSGKSVMEV